MKKIKVVELFAGVGGFRLGLEGWDNKSASSGYEKDIKTPFEIIWSNQYEPLTPTIQHANLVYKNRWPNSNHSCEDIAHVVENKFDTIPDHDLLVGGFPCQDYSVATTLKKSQGLIGKKGVLWWQIERILRKKGERSPSYLILENVDRLLSSPVKQRGRDFAIMLASLSDLGYAVEWRIINAAEYGMPQRRKRVFIIAYKKNTNIYKEISSQKELFLKDGILNNAFAIKDFNIKDITKGKIEGSLNKISSKFNYAHKKNAKSPFLKSGIMINRLFYCIDNEVDNSKNILYKYSTLGDVLEPNKNVPNEFKISKENLHKWEIEKGAKKILRTNKETGYKYWFSEGKMSLIDDLNKASRTIITAEGGKSASRFKHLIKNGRTYRRLLPIELERLNMFPDNHTKLEGITNTKRAFFMGNALVVGVIEKIGEILANRIKI
tara:strand:- start:745 stop:2052 length:1308 start_codon:yes stop_codon:yes gene_type:complete